ncbi:hypothetical protein ABZ470_31790 [Streptosporangium sp. NPDC020072]|uniref:hypothetical protein n=1 Tax=Streptosporangium sp. NPDC020072 TaxID=3154788 RepID=UPI003413B5D5
MSLHVGKVGGWLKGECEIIHISRTGKTRTPYWFYMLIDADGDKFKWWSPDPVDFWQIGRIIHIKGRVKRHDTHDETGEQFTVLEYVHSIGPIKDGPLKIRG